MRVLAAFYYWPPSGGPGVQRGVKLCRHLADAGCDVTVVTAAEAEHRRPGEYPPDRTLSADLDGSAVRVVRTRDTDGAAAFRAAQRWRLIPAAQRVAPSRFFERQAWWAGPLADALVREIEARRPDVLLTSSQPYAAHLAGLAATRATGVPWTADFRDPWTQAWGRTWTSERVFRWEESREDEVLLAADRIAANTPGCRRELLARRPWIDAAKVEVVTNGYDPDDFPAGAAAPDPSRFTVVHSGSFRAKPPGAPPSRRPGFRPVPYDLSTHGPADLFAAVAACGGTVGGRPVRIRLIGSDGDRWAAAADAAGLRGVVEASGYLPHRESVSAVLAADALFLPTITRTDGAPVANVPAKTYEYIGSGRPVIAVADRGDVADLVARFARCAVVRPGDPAALRDALERAAAGALPPSAPDPEDAAPWRRREIAARMRRLLDAARRRNRTDAAPEEPTIPAS